jgi:hypothetical protein
MRWESYANTTQGEHDVWNVEEKKSVYIREEEKDVLIVAAHKSVYIREEEKDVLIVAAHKYVYIREEEKDVLIVAAHKYVNIREEENNANNVMEQIQKKQNTAWIVIVKLETMIAKAIWLSAFN